MKSGRTVVSENFFRRFKEVFAPYLSMLDVDSRVLERADIEIPVEQYLALWEAAGKVNPNVGLELGMQSEPDDIGALGHAIHCATTVEKALLTLQQFIIVFAQESNIKLEFESRTICIEYGVTYPTVISKRQDSEFAIAAILRQLNLITASTIRPTRVDFAHSKPADISAHKLLFQCPIHFNQPANRICLPIETLQLPVAHGNERLYKALEPYLEKERQVRTVTDELLPQITRIVAAEMSSGAPSIDEICDQLNLSRRTLQRRLKEHGIEFSTLIEDVRRELALSYMKESNYSMTEISLLVGYSESASFTRAFRRWTGQSPQQYRAAHLAS